MIRNIPNKYTSKLVREKINVRFRNKYDFFYLPMDFKHKCNYGYAFINLTHEHEIIPFYKEFNQKKWEYFKSNKVILFYFFDNNRFVRSSTRGFRVKLSWRNISKIRMPCILWEMTCKTSSFLRIPSGESRNWLWDKKINTSNDPLFIFFYSNQNNLKC